jgi:hypothetical protein
MPYRGGAVSVSQACGSTRSRVGQAATARRRVLPLPRLRVSEGSPGTPARGILRTVASRGLVERRANEENRPIIALLAQRIPEIGTPQEPREVGAGAIFRFF